MKSKTFSKILEELNWPPLVFVHPRQFAKMPGGFELGKKYAGGAIEELGVVTAAPWVRGKARTNTLWHEVSHCLRPDKPEWWHYLVGCRMAGGGGTGGEECTNGHSLSELPARDELLGLLIRAATKRQK